MKLKLIILFVLLNSSVYSQIKKNLAPTPPMGWNSWNWFGKKEINEQNMKECMDAMVNQGLLKAGYNYFVIDGGWRDTKLGPNGELLANPEKFPHGMKALADYAHSKGLKFGLHTVPGTNDCGGDFVGGYGHEEVQVKQFADWGLDFIKLDKCKFSGGWDEEVLKHTYTKWRSLLDNSGRDIVLSISAYIWRDWYPEVGQMARTTGDIATITNNPYGARFNFTPEGKKLFYNVMEISETNNQSAEFAGNGYWNDPDMLVTGKQGLSEHEQESHFGLWCIMSSPLFLGNDPRTMSQFEKKLIKNREMIAVNQDATEQGRLIKNEGNTQVWAKKLKDGRVAIMLLNLDKTSKKEISINFKDFGFTGEVKVSDLLHGKKLGVFKKSISKNADTNQCWFLILSNNK